VCAVTAAVALAVLSAMPAGAVAFQSRLDRLWSQMTAAERLRAELFAEFAQGQPLTEASQGSLLAVRPLVRGDLPSTPDAIRDLTCESDAVLAGTVTAAASHPTVGGRFIFTDYTLDVAAVLLADEGDVAVGEPITVSRPGGRFDIDGLTFAVDHSRFPPMRPDGLYVVFATRVAATGSYLANAAGSAYQCADGACTRTGLPGRVDEERLRELVTASSRRCR
jgi:hypothetical protein